MSRRKANLSLDEDILSYVKTRSAATGESMALIVNSALHCFKALEEALKTEAVPVSVFKAAGIDVGIKHHNHRSSRLERAQ